MARPAIDPQRRKKSASFTLSNEQRILCEWTANQLHISASEMVGKLIEREAKRIAKKNKVQLPDTDPNQITI